VAFVRSLLLPGVTVESAVCVPLCSFWRVCLVLLQSGLKNLREHALMELMVVSVDVFTTSWQHQGQNTLLYKWSELVLHDYITMETTWSSILAITSEGPDTSNIRLLFQNQIIWLTGNQIDSQININEYKVKTMFFFNYYNFCLFDFDLFIWKFSCKKKKHLWYFGRLAFLKQCYFLDSCSSEFVLNGLIHFFFSHFG